MAVFFTDPGTPELMTLILCRLETIVSTRFKRYCKTFYTLVYLIHNPSEGDQPC